MSSHNRTVTRQSQTDCLIQTVHRIGRKHTRAAATTRTSMTLDLSDPLIINGRIGRLNHRIDQVQVATIQFSCLHRTARNENRRDVQTHRSHQHTRGDLVAIADADHRIGLMRIDHVFDTISNDVARWQRIEHTVVSHSNTVVNRNRVELGCKATQLLDLSLHQLTHLVQMHMSGYELRKRIDNSDDRLPKLFFLHAIGTPQGTRTCHSAAFCAK